MSTPADRANNRQESGRISAIILIAILIIAAQFGVRIFALNKAERFAVTEASEHVDIAAGAAAEGFRRQIDSWTRVQEIMEWFIRNSPDGYKEQEFIARRLRQLAAINEYAISTIALFSTDGEFHLGTGPEAPPAADGRPLPARGFLVDPPVRTGEATWLIALRFALPVRADGARSYGVITLDGRRLSHLLATFEGRPGQRVGLWRGDGTFLAGTAKPEEMIARKLVSPLLPGPEGRLVAQRASPIDSDARIVALRAFAGQDMFLTLSVARNTEMALFDQIEKVAVVLEVGVAVVLLTGAVLLIGMTRARSRAELALARAEADHRLAVEIQAAQREVLEGVDAGVYAVRVGADDHHARDEFNSGTARLIRRSMEELRAVNGVLAFAEPKVPEEALLAVIGQLRATGVGQMEARIRCGDGDLRWFRFQLRVTSRDGDALRCIGLMTDIEVEKAASAAAIVTARLATLGELSAGIAHEMKQPLAAISLVAETTRLRLASPAPPATADIAAALDRIAGLVERANSVTEHLRGIARSQDGAVVPFAVRAAVDGALMMCGFALRDAGITAEIALPADLPAAAGSQVLVEQVLMNLFINARDAMGDMPVAARRLWVTAAVEAEQVVVRVRDAGPGIPPHVMARLFEPFVTTKPSGIGTGLGLSICASILKAAGGGISAANPPGGGAEFRVALPRAPIAGS